MVFPDHTHLPVFSMHSPNKQISVFRVMVLKILGRLGTPIFLIVFSEKKKQLIYAF